VNRLFDHSHQQQTTTMQQYDNTNTGVLFINDKGDNPKRPDRKGSLNVDGKDYWISGWVREKDGKPYMSLKVERKEQQTTKPAPPQAAPLDDDDGDAIPF
jgi:hypothetical protein